MCIYHVSWLSNYGFCCEIDEECARELAGEYDLLTFHFAKLLFLFAVFLTSEQLLHCDSDIPGVLSVQPDENYESEIKDYGG